MIIHYVTTNDLAKNKDRKSVLIGKMWLRHDAYNFAVGEVGVMHREKDKLENVFNNVELHPGDRIALKSNWRKRTRKDPDFLLYIENVKAKVD